MTCRNDENPAYEAAGFKTLCKSCAEKIFKEQNPTLKAIKRIFADARFDVPDPKFSPMEPKFSPGFLRGRERAEAQHDRFERDHHDRLCQTIKEIFPNG